MRTEGDKDTADSGLDGRPSHDGLGGVTSEVAGRCKSSAIAV